MKHIVDILLKTKGLPDEKEILKGANVTQVVDNIVA